MERFLRELFWSDEGDYGKESRRIFQYNHSNGKLYGITDAGRIRSSNAREGMVTQRYFKKGQGGTLDSAAEEEDPSVKEFDIAPELDITVERFVMNRSGTVGVVAGTRMGDAETSGVMVLHMARPGGRHGTEIPAIPLDEKMYVSRPGLHILHMEWHPDSEVHVLVLTSDHTLRLYNVEAPEFAEQTFELRLHTLHFTIDDENDAGSWNEPVPVSFAFGKGKGWNRMSIIVLMSNGDLRVLCPVAPFGARYSGRWLLSLFDNQKGEEERVQGLTGESLVWVYKAFCVDDVNDIDKEGVYSVVPHALESHVPRLSPALKIASNAQESVAFHAVSCHAWVMSSMLGMVLASDTGMIRAGIVSRGLEPAWSLNPPQCIFHEGFIRAVRSQCVGQKLLESRCSQSASFVVIDDVYLPEGSRQNASTAELCAANFKSRSIDIFQDSTNPLTFVVGQQLNAYAVTFPWISLIAEYLSSDHMPDKLPPQLPDVLPLPKVSEIAKIDSNMDCPFVSHVLLGDKLSGTALLSIQCNGSFALHKVAKSIHIATIQDHATEEVEFQRQSKERLLDHLRKKYAPITTAPEMTKRHTFDTAAAADTPENYKAFVESVADLRNNLVAYCHQAGHTIIKRIEILKSEVSKQLDTVTDVSQLLIQVEKKQELLKFRQEKAQWMASNIEDRVRLLAELHWAAPRPQSEAEKHFQHHELPLLESSTAALAREIDMLRSQATALKKSRTSSNHPEVPGDLLKHDIQPHAMRKIREILSEHDSMIRESSIKVHVIDQFLSQRNNNPL